MSIRLSTPVDTTPLPTIGTDSRILLLGSCFTDAVGERMERCGMKTLRNPFGVLYNPFSIATCLEYCLDDTPLEETMLVHHEGLWHSWLHHTTLSHPDRAECLRQCNERIDAAHRFLQECDTLVITWGTAYAYFLTTQMSDQQNCASQRATDHRPLTTHSQILVANCHKVPARHFERRRLSVEEIVDRWQPLLQRLAQLPKKPRIIFTVSPIRHMADGAHGNQLSKATLHLAIDLLCNPTTKITHQAHSQFTLHNSQLSYFPAYEIMMDELRDYRYYDRDMTHPSELAVDIIWERFQQTYLLPETMETVKQNEKKIPTITTQENRLTFNV